jgi:hypothetical protein
MPQKSRRSCAINLLVLIFVAVPAMTVQSQTGSAKLPPPSFLLSVPGVFSASEDITKLVFSWTPTEGVTTYTLQIATDKHFAHVVLERGFSSKESRFDLSSSEEDQKKFVPGKKYYWRVAAECDRDKAECPRNIVIAGNAPRSFITAYEPFSRVTQLGLRLQRALTGPDEGEAATFGFLSPIEKRTIFMADFALIWQGKKLMEIGRAVLAPQLSLDGSIATDRSEAEDAVRFGSAFILDIPIGPTTLRPVGIYASLGFKYETDRDLDTQKGLFSSVVTPTVFGVIGTPLGTPGSVQFRWRPFLGIDVGHTFKNGDSEEESGTVLRLMPRVRAEVFLDFVAYALNLPQVTLYTDNTFFYLPLQDKTHNFLVAGLEFDVTENLSVVFTYKKGENSPKFEHTHTIGGSIGIKF